MRNSREQVWSRLARVCLWLLVLGGWCSAKGAVLRWDPSPGIVAGYNVYLTAGGNTLSTNVGNVTELNLAGLLVNGLTYTISITAYSSSGIESAPSEPITHFVPHVAPAILAQPSSLTVRPGTMVSLTVQASGSGTLRYQWFRNGLALDAVTNATYLIPISLSSHSGSYWVRVSNPGGEVLSRTANLTVLPGAPIVAPVIVSQPQSVMVEEGSPVELRVGADSGGFLQYEWWRNGSPVAGATSPTLSIPAAGRIDDGTYFVILSSPAGSVVSQAADVAVLFRPRILSQPVRIDVPEGESASLFPIFSGSEPLDIQWFKDGAPIPGAVESVLQFIGLQLTDTGLYHVRISNPAGTVETEPVPVTVYLPPEIPFGPENVTVARGETAVLKVEPSGTAPFDFQWFRSGAEIPGATNAELKIVSAQYPDSGDYQVMVGNPAGTVTSGRVTLSVGGPKILSQLADVAVNEGGTATINVVVTGEAPFSYQWFKDGAPIAGEKNPQLILAKAQLSDAAEYTVRIANLVGSAISKPVRLTVLAAPRFAVELPDTNVSEGGDGVLAPEILGSEPLSYQWFKNGESLAGETNRTLLFTSAARTDGGDYQVHVSNPLGSAQSRSARVTIVAVPRIASHPVSTTIREGATLMLSVSAVGEGTLTYQWVKDGIDLPGANQPIFRIASAQASDGGSYAARVSNFSGSKMSAAATVTVLVLPAIVTQFSSVTTSEGSPLELAVDVESETPVAWQWMKDGLAIPGATNAVFAVPTVRLADQGTYLVKISNAAGTITSGASSVTVLTRPRINLHPVGANIAPGGSVFLTVQASGSGTLTFQWFKDDQIIPGATIPALIIGGAKSSDLGAYFVRVSNSAGSVESARAEVRFLAAPAIVEQPAATNLVEGGTLALSVKASGTPAPAFQWLKNGQALNGATNQSLVITSAQTANSGNYAVRASNSAGSVISSAVAVGVLSPVSISAQPASFSVAEGAGFNLGVIAGGSGVLSYQWFRNGNPIPGAQSPILAVASAQASDSGLYTVAVSNPVSLALTEPAFVTVQAAGTDLEQEAGKIAAINSISGMKILAKGVPGQTYQVQACSDLRVCDWKTIQTVTVSSAGVFEIRPLHSTTPPSAQFFRTVRAQ